MFRLGYNTNGLAHHRLLESLELVSELGYEALAITPDVGQLDLFQLDADEVGQVARRSSELGLELAVETGARFVLDPRRKHFPSLLEDTAAERARRLDYLLRSVDLAQLLGANVVSIWAGVAPGGATGDEGQHPALMERLCDELRKLLRYARGSGVQIAFEPEPGMFIERPCGYERLVEQLGADGDTLGLTLDVGHLLVTNDLPVAKTIRDCAHRIVHVHLDDIRDGVHEHVMFGAGELDLPATLSALLEADYTGIAAVELSRDSHRGAQAAAEAMDMLRAALAHTA